MPFLLVIFYFSISNQSRMELVIPRVMDGPDSIASVLGFVAKSENLLEDYNSWEASTTPKNGRRIYGV